MILTRVPETALAYNPILHPPRLIFYKPASDAPILAAARLPLPAFLYLRHGNPLHDTYTATVGLRVAVYSAEDAVGVGVTAFPVVEKGDPGARVTRLGEKTVRDPRFPLGEDSHAEVVDVLVPVSARPTLIMDGLETSGTLAALVEKFLEGELRSSAQAEAELPPAHRRGFEVKAERRALAAVNPHAAGRLMQVARAVADEVALRVVQEGPLPPGELEAVLGRALAREPEPLSPMKLAAVIPGERWEEVKYSFQNPSLLTAPPQPAAERA